MGVSAPRLTWGSPGSPRGGSPGSPPRSTTPLYPGGSGSSRPPRRRPRNEVQSSEGGEQNEVGWDPQTRHPPSPRAPSPSSPYPRNPPRPDPTPPNAASPLRIPPKPQTEPRTPRGPLLPRPSLTAAGAGPDPQESGHGRGPVVLDPAGQELSGERLRGDPGRDPDPHRHHCGGMEGGGSDGRTRRKCHGGIRMGINMAASIGE